MMVEWNVFKTFINARSLSIQWIDLDSKYWLNAFDGNFSLECTLIKNLSNNFDVADFEDNYKAEGNKKLQLRNAEGYAVLAPTFEDSQGLTTVWKGHLYTAQPNSLNIFDEIVTTQLKLRGGWYKILDANANIGDYIEFSIVDKDNVLGLFSLFGLTVGVDILELKKFVRTEYISPLDIARQDFQSAGASEVMAGLYFRTQYYNSGLIPVKLSVTEKYHEA